MAPLVQKQKRKGARRQLVSAVGMFYPGEVAKILGLRDIDYRQLKELAAVASPARQRTRRKWGRYSFKDLVILRNALNLAGGVEALKIGRHLRLRQLSRVIKVLQTQLGVAEPLAEIKLERSGSTIIASVSGGRLDPMKSQYVFAEILGGVETYLKRQPDRGPKKNLREIKLQRSQIEARSHTVGNGTAISVLEGLPIL